MKRINKSGLEMIKLKKTNNTILLRKLFIISLIIITNKSFGQSITWYQDNDNDGWGNPSVTQSSVTKPTGYVQNNFDCNDNNTNSSVWSNVGSAGISAFGANNTAIVVDGNGIPYVGYNNNGNGSVVYKFNGSAWTMVGTENFSGQPIYSSMALDNDNNPYFAAQNNNSGQAPTIMKFASGSWSTLGGSNPTSDGSAFNSLAIDGSNNVYYAYKELYSTHANKATVMKYNGSSWAAVGSRGFSSGSVNFTSLALTSSGTPYLAFQDGNSSNKATVMMFNGSSWVNVGSTGISNGTASYISLTIDKSGTPYVAYNDGSYSNKLVVKKYNGSTWVNVGASTGLSTGTANYITIKTDGNNTPYVAYSDANNSDRGVVISYNGSSWVQVVSANISSASATHLSMTIDPYGIPYVAFRDGNSSNRVTVMKIEMVKNLPSTPIASSSPAFSCSAGTATLTVTSGTLNDATNWKWYSGSCGGTLVGTGSSIVTTVTATTTYYVRGENNCPSSNGACGFASVTIRNSPLWYQDNDGDGWGNPSVIQASCTKPVGYVANNLDCNDASSNSTQWYTIGGGPVSTNQALWTTVAIDANNIPYVGYYDDYNKGTVRSFTSSWSAAGTALFTPSRTTHNDLAFDPSGVLHMVFQDDFGGVSVMKYSGGSWSLVGPRNFSLGQATYTSIAFDAAGTPYVAFVDGYFTHTDKVSVMKYNGASWVVVGSYGFSPGTANYTSLAIDGGGNPYVAFSDGNSSDRLTVMKYNGSAWNIVGSAGFSAQTASYCKMKLDASGVPYVVFSDGNVSNKSTVMKYNGSSWANVGSAGFSAGTASFTSIAITSTGHPIVVYKDGGNSDKATVMRFNGTSWVVYGSAGFSSGSVNYTSIALDAFDLPVIAYQDASNSNRPTVMKVGPLAVAPSTPTAGASSSTISCGNSTTLSASGTLNGAGAWYWYRGSCGGTYVGMGNSIAVAPSSTTTYFVRGEGGCLTTPGNCGSTTITVTAATPSLPAITGTLPECVGSVRTLANATPGGTWSSSNTSIATAGASSGIITGVSVGNATITYSWGGTCGSTFTTATMTVNPNPAYGPITGTTTTSVGNTITLSHSTPGGTWSSANSYLASVNSSGTVTGIAPGTVRISYTINDACGAFSATTLVSVNPASSIPPITGTFVICSGGSSALSNTTSGGVWTSSNTSIATVGTNGIVTGVAQGTATISYTVGVEMVNAVVTINPLPNAGTIIGTATVCPLATTNLSNAQAGGVWSSSNNAIATVGTGGGVTGVASGTATISYSVSNSCGTAHATQVVTVNPLPNAGTITGTATVCITSTTTLSNAQAGGVWSSSNSAIANVGTSGVVTGVSQGIATISYSVTNSCGTAHATQVVTVNIFPSAGTITGTATICTATTTTLNNAQSGGMWASSNNAVATVGTGGVVTGVAVGTATISYSITNSCGTDYATQVVTVNAVPNAVTANATPNPICSGSSLALTSSANSNIVGGGTVCGTVSENGTLTLTAPAGTVFTSVTFASYGTPTGSCGSFATSSCHAATSLSVVQSYLIGNSTASIPATNLVFGDPCSGTSKFLYVEANYSYSATYNWSGPNGFSSTTQNPTAFAVSPSSAGVYTVTASNACGSAIATRAVTVNPLPSVGSITGTSVVCTSATTSLTNTQPGGIWSSSNSAIATIGTNGIVTGVSYGNATISYAVTNSCGTNFATQVVTVNAVPSAVTATATPNPICSSSNLTLTSSAINKIVSGTVCGTANEGGSITLTAPLGAVFTGISFASYGTPTGSCSSFATGTCHSTTSVSVVESYLIGNSTATIPASNTVFGDPCTGTLKRLYVQAIYSYPADYQWSGPNGFSSTVQNPSAFAVTSANAGIYTVTATNSCGTASATQVVTVNPLPNAGTITGTATVCPLATTTLSNAQAGGVWTSSNAAIATVGTNGVVTGVAQGNVTISYAVTNSCGTDYATRVVTVNPLPNAGTITGTATVCPTAATTLTNAQAGGVWTSSNTAIATVGTNGIVTGVAQGNATISYAVTNSCGTAYAVQVVTVNPLPNAGTITGTATVCPSATTTLSNAQAAGMWTSSNAAVATVGTNGVVTGVAQGNVTISYAVTNSCGTAYATQVVTVNPLPNTGIITGTATVCTSSNTSLTNAQAGGVWTSSNTSIASVGTNGVVTGVAQGNATISYAVTNSCGTLYATQVVTVYALPNAGTIAGANSTCAGTSLSLSNTQPSGIWTSSNIAVATIDAGGVISSLLSGTTTISYTITNSDGCSSVATKIVTVNAQPIISSPTGSFTVCKSGSLTLSTSVAGGAWISSNSAAATIGAGNGVVNGIDAGTSSITYNIVTSGCRATVVLTVNTSPTFISNPAPLCPGETTTMTALPAGGTWTSNNPAVMAVNASTGQITAVINNYSGNSITFINYITADGCSGARMVTVKRVPAPIYGGVRNMCTAENTTLLCGTPGNIWTSTTPAVATINSSGVVSSIAAGTTIISYTNTDGCASTTTVTVNSTLPANTGSNTVCTGQTTTLSNAVPGGTWSISGNAASINSLTGLVTGINAGTVNISYRIGVSCFSVTQVTVNSNAPAISGTLSACEGTTTALNFPSTAGAWSSSNTAIASINPTSGLVTGISSGTTTISYIMTASCFKTAVVTVTAVPAAITGTAVMCEGSSTTLNNSGGTWSSSNTAIAVVNSLGQVAGISAGNANITYRIASTSCYTVREVTVNPLPVITPVTMCEGDTVTMVASPTGGTWTSNNSSVAVLNPTIGNITGVYLSHTSIGVAAINYTSPIGCSRISVVTLNPTPANIVNYTASICAGNNVILTSSTSGAIWSSSNSSVATVNSSGLMSALSQGTTTITYGFASGCYAIKTLTVNPLPTVNAITGTLSICRFNSSSLSNTTIGGTWSSSNTSVASITNTGLVTGNNAGNATISYSITNEFGCTNRVFATMSVNPYPVVSAISGATGICIGNSSSLSNSNPDGIWTSSNAAVAAIGTNGIVTGVATGTASISYTVTNAFGCSTQVSTMVTVSPPPTVAPITGSLNVCKFDNTMLSNTTPSGVWASSNTSVASVNPGGIVTTTNVGTSTISYTVNGSLGCSTTVTKVVTVNEIPAITSPSGLEICEGATFTVNSSISNGTWSSSDPAKAVIGLLAGNLIGMNAGNTTITFTANGSGCFTTENFLVKSAPTNITTVPALCKGNTITLSSLPASGTWNSLNPTTVSVNAATGLITAIINNHSDISYATITYTISNGCSKSTIVTVNPHPADIYGTTLNLCAGQSTIAITGSTGGTWSSSNSAVATISPTGNITSIAAGTTVISYTNSFGCAETEIVTVNPLLAPNTGTTSICSGTTTILSNATPGGTWTSSNNSVASINATSGFVTSTMAGTTSITYTAPTGCNTTSIITVNPIPAIIVGATSLCQGNTSSFSVTPITGTWSSSNTAVATINETSGLLSAIAAGTVQVTYSNSGGCFRTATVTVNALPADITGSPVVCAGGGITALSNTSGTWTSSNNSIASVNFLGSVTGVNAGNATITFRNAANCITTRLVTVNPLPNTFTTPNNLCAGSTATLVGSPSGGTWLSSNNAVFTVNSTTGDMTAVVVNYGSLSLSVVTYTLPTGCKRTALVTVNPMPAPIYGGTTSICTGNNTTFLCGTSGATWSSSAPAIATINSSGNITGINSGTATISYTNSYGCAARRTITVNESPANITGDNIVTTGASVTLSNATIGGTWSSNNTSKASINATTGIAIGISTGTANISYTMSNGCFKTKTITVVAPKNEIVTSETNNENSSNYSVYPNPTSGSLTITTDNTGTFKIFTVDGRMIETRNITDATTNITLPNTLAAGYYVCQFIGNDGTQKIVRILYQP